MAESLSIYQAAIAACMSSSDAQRTSSLLLFNSLLSSYTPKSSFKAKQFNGQPALFLFIEFSYDVARSNKKYAIACSNCMLYHVVRYHNEDGICEQFGETCTINGCVPTERIKAHAALPHIIDSKIVINGGTQEFIDPNVRELESARQQVSNLSERFAALQKSFDTLDEEKRRIELREFDLAKKCITLASDNDRLRAKLSEMSAALNDARWNETADSNIYELFGTSRTSSRKVSSRLSTLNDNVATIMTHLGIDTMSKITDANDPPISPTQRTKQSPIGSSRIKQRSEYVFSEGN